MLILVRHGNTFGPLQRAVYVGAHQDMDLVPTGEAQARALGQTLSPVRQRLRRVVTSPMKRTMAHAQLMCAAAGIAVPIETEPRLRELDYGVFAGRHRQELVDEGFAEALRGWEEEAMYPDDAGFAPPRHEVVAGLQAWLWDLTEDFWRHPGALTVAVTHGGILRLLFHMLLTTPKTPPGNKMACGHVGLVSLEGDGPTLCAWNEPAGAPLLALLQP